jgi:hypothetical protein
MRPMRFMQAGFLVLVFLLAGCASHTREIREYDYYRPVPPPDTSRSYQYRYESERGNDMDVPDGTTRKYYREYRREYRE